MANVNTTQDCVHFRLDHGTWDDDNCDKMYKYICGSKGIYKTSYFKELYEIIP